MVSSAPNTSTLQLRLERRLDAVHGRDRLTAEFHRVAVDVIGRAEHDELDAADKLVLHRAMDRAIRATEAEVADRFVHELADALAAAPDGLLERLARAELRREIGLD